MSVKEMFCITTGFISSFVLTFFGGWDLALSTLVWCIAIDYLTGLIVAGVFKKSKKTKTGTLSSYVSWKGLCRKFVTIIFVGFAHRLDLFMGTNILKDAVAISFIVNEVISICENVGLMGIPIPQSLKKAIEVLKQKEGE